MFRNFKKYSSRVALIDNITSYTYEDLENYSKIFPLNKNKKNLIIILTENKIEPIIGYVSCLLKKQLCYLVDSNTESNFLRALITKYKPHMIFANQQKIKEFPNYKKILDFKNYCLLESKSLLNYPIHKDLALLLGTSGSTGSPKCVKISSKSLSFNTFQIQKTLKMNKVDRTITTMPFHYTYGLSIINTHLSVGASIVISNNKVFENEFWKLIKKYSINNFGAVAYMYEMIKKINPPLHFFKKIKYLTHAGGPIDNNILDYIIKKFSKKIKFFNMYGSVEACSRISILDYKFLISKKKSIGTGMPGTKIYIKNSKTRGELCFSGKNIFSGYANSLQNLGSLSKLKYFNTGDLAEKDDDNFYYIVGRKSRYIKMLSNRIYLSDVENYINNCNIKNICIGSTNKIIFFCNLRLKNKILNLCNNKFKINKNFIFFNSYSEVAYTQNNKINYNYLEKKFI